LEVKFPRDPKVAAAPTRIVNQLVTMGITVSGLLFYGATEGPVPTESAWGDPYYNKMLDTCGGHAGPQNEYHYHALLTIALCNLKNTGIIAYAIDGFPFGVQRVAWMLIAQRRRKRLRGMCKRVTQPKMCGRHIRSRLQQVKQYSMNARVASNPMAPTDITQR
jgi:hypothetical protein